MADAERRHILEALHATNWVVGGPKGAAALLGLKRSTLQSRMEKLGIQIARAPNNRRYFGTCRYIGSLKFGTNLLNTK